MPVRRAAVHLTSLAVLGFAAACSDSGPSTGVESLPMMRPVQPPDAATLSRTIPGFGGLFLDGDVPTVYLTDVSQRRAAERMLGAVQVRPARFAYRDLDRWFEAMSREVFATGPVVFVDLDEAANRVLVGVERGMAHANVRALAARLGIPAEAVVVRDADPIHPVATLRDLVRPVVAGLQINFGQFVCSIGFNATSGSQASFVTASHCTNTQGGVEGTQYFQPLASTGGSFIGTEVADPSYFRGGACPRGRKCRYSDAARAAYASGVSFDLGGIAATNAPNNGSLTIAGTYSITAEGTALVGQTASKIGRTTGWTQGTVTNTCVNTGVSGSNIVQLCQTFVSAGVGGGDSGSDVFALAGGTATLLGVLWGGNSSGTQFVYSPMSGVERDLGPLTTF